MTGMDNRVRGKTRVSATFRNRVDLTLAEAGHLPADQVRAVTATAVVDPEAVMVVLPQEIADQLGLPEQEEVAVRAADGRTAVCKLVEECEVEILGRRSAFRAIVEPGRKDPLIGLLVLATLDFLVDPRNQTVVPRDPERLFFELD